MQYPTAITMEYLRSRGVTLAFVAKQASIPYHRVQRAVSGYGIGWLEPDEQQRLVRTFTRLGLLEVQPGLTTSGGL